MSLVAVGGGTGLAALLSGLKGHVGGEIARLSAIVAVTDDGGSSGRLRRDLGLLPPGGKEGDELKYYRHVIQIKTANGITQAGNVAPTTP